MLILLIHNCILKQELPITKYPNYPIIFSTYKYNKGIFRLFYISLKRGKSGQINKNGDLMQIWE